LKKVQENKFFFLENEKIKKMIKIINKIDLSSFIDLIYLIDKTLVISFNILNIVNKKLIYFEKNVSPILGVQPDGHGCHVSIHSIFFWMRSVSNMKGRARDLDFD